MRNLIFGNLGLMVLATLFLISCQKEGTSNSQEIEKFMEITHSYLETTHNNEVELLPKWLKIVGADLGGMITGAGTGAGIGTVIGAPGGPAGSASGAATGAIIGGVIGGASASIKAAYPAGSNNNEMKIDFTPIYNLANPYDYVGANHYQAINQALENDINYIENNEFDASKFYDFTKDLLIDNDIVGEIDFQHYSKSDNLNVLDVVKDNEMYNISDFLNNYENDFITENVKTVLGPYF